MPVWIEPTDISLVNKIFESKTIEAIKFISPNFDELKKMHTFIFGRSDSGTFSLQSRNDVVKLSSEYSHDIMEKFDSLYSILTTIGKHGIVYTTREEDIDRSIKLGPNSQLYNEDYSNKKINVYNLEQQALEQIRNVSGAGDCMVAGILFGLIHQLTIHRSLELGLMAARLSVQTDETVPKQIKTIL